MSETPERIWEKVAPHLRRHLGLHRPSLEEAQAAFDAVEDEPLSAQLLRDIADFAKGKASFPKPPPKKRWLEGFVAALSGPQLVPVMNRNPGDEDVSVDELMDKLRKEALTASDDEPEEDMDPAPGEKDE